MSVYKKKKFKWPVSILKMSNSTNVYKCKLVWWYYFSLNRNAKVERKNNIKPWCSIVVKGEGSHRIYSIKISLFFNKNLYKHTCTYINNSPMIYIIPT